MVPWGMPEFSLITEMSDATRENASQNVHFRFNNLHGIILQVVEDLALMNAIRFHAALDHRLQEIRVKAKNLLRRYFKNTLLTVKKQHT